MIKRGLCLVILAWCTPSQCDDPKWVWSARSGEDDSSRKVYTGASNIGTSTKALLTQPRPSSSGALFKPSQAHEDVVPHSTRLRYEVTELENARPPNIYPEESFGGSRPDSSSAGSGAPVTFGSADSYRPINNINRPNVGYASNTNNYRPDNFRPGQGSGYRPQTSVGYQPNQSAGFGHHHGSGAGFGSTSRPGERPILTGPRPSWENRDRDRYRDFDRCKCVHSFNCNSPGLQFGSCDVDKRYCCHKNAHNERPHNGYHSGEYNGDGSRPILTGPNGPVGGGGGGSRPILTGPNGPFDRPYHNRPSIDRYDGPSRYPDNNRYSNNYRDSTFGTGSLDEAYKRGLESAIHETVQALTGAFNSREYESSRDHQQLSELSDFNRRPSRYQGKYGLQRPTNYYGGRSANTTILAEKL